MSRPQITVNWMRQWLTEQLAEEAVTLVAVTTAGESIRVAYRVPPDRDLVDPFEVTGTEGTIATAYTAAVEHADIWTPPLFHAVALPAAGQDGVMWTLEADWVHDIGDGEEWSDDMVRCLLERASETPRLQNLDDESGSDRGSRE